MGIWIKLIVKVYMGFLWDVLRAVGVKFPDMGVVLNILSWNPASHF